MLHRLLRVAMVSLVLVLGLLGAGPGSAKTGRGAAVARTSAGERSCRAAVQAFYDRYARLVQQDRPTLAPWDRAVKARPASFDRELRRWLAVDAAARARRHDEIVGLDFDPFLNSQDPARVYRVQRIVRGKAGYRAYVHAVYAGKVSRAPSVMPELVQRRGRWTFVNFHYLLDEHLTETADLLSFLKGRDRERREEERKTPRRASPAPR
jgi:hypothetical protein